MSCDIGFVHAPNYWMECLPTKQRKLTAAPKRVSPPKMPIEAVKEVTDQKVPMSQDIGFVHAPNYWMECLPTKQRKLTAAPKRVSPPKMPIEAVKEVTDQKVQRQLGSKLMQSTISKSYRVSKN